MNFFKISFGAFLVIAASRFVPHPPNFTSLIALSFYVPVVFGYRYIPSIIISFAITDLIIGFHDILFFTWGSVLIIGLITKYFRTTLSARIIGALSGAIIFFIITNFGVWSSGYYGYSIEGFILCFTLAIPFFAQNILSTFIYSAIIESIIKIYSAKFKKVQFFK